MKEQKGSLVATPGSRGLMDVFLTPHGLIKCLYAYSVAAFILLMDQTTRPKLHPALGKWITAKQEHIPCMYLDYHVQRDRSVRKRLKGADT